MKRCGVDILVRFEDIPSRELGVMMSQLFTAWVKSNGSFVQAVLRIVPTIGADHMGVNREGCRIELMSEITG